jgi:S-adenosylmethionine/arginine decarboxylase-like enzyme
MVDTSVMMCADPSKFWGQEFIFNCSQGDKSVMEDKEYAQKFIDELVKEIDMEKHGTMVQLIKTSSIVIHFCSETGDFYGNIFSCKRFFGTKALDLICKYYKPNMVQHTMLERGV